MHGRESRPPRPSISVPSDPTTLSLSSILSLIGHNRPSVRISALLSLCSFLSSFSLSSSSSLSSLHVDLVRAIDRHGEETELALRTVGLLAVIGGKEMVGRVLMNKVRDVVMKRQSQKVREEALRTFAVVLFMERKQRFAAVAFFHYVLCLMTIPSGSDLPVAMKTVVEAVPHASLGGGKARTEEEEQNDNESIDKAITACITGWTLLASLLSAQEMQVVEFMEERFISLLESENRDVKLSAGIAIALIRSAQYKRESDNTLEPLNANEYEEELILGASHKWSPDDEEEVTDDDEEVTDEIEVEVFEREKPMPLVRLVNLLVNVSHCMSTFCFL